MIRRTMIGDHELAIEAKKLKAARLKREKKAHKYQQVQIYRRMGSFFTKTMGDGIK